MQLALLAARVLDFLFPPKDTARIVRETTPETFGALLAPSVCGPEIVALLPYRHSRVRAAVVEAKFNGNEKAWKLLGAAVADYLAALTEESEPLADESFILVPIPLGRARRRERGYNQVERVLGAAGVRYESLLQRARETRAQTSLSRRARLLNMQDAFVASGSVSPDVTYIVFDDVMTTGATLEAAMAALRGAGATSVRGLALAH